MKKSNPKKNKPEKHLFREWLHSSSSICSLLIFGAFLIILAVFFCVCTPIKYDLRVGSISHATIDAPKDVIDDALSYDFEGTLRWAAVLRSNYFMRLNPQVIMVRAALHPDRVRFNQEHPGLFSEINRQVMSRADEPGSQLAYYLYRSGSKKKIPSVLKRNWAAKLSSLNAYQVHKYKNTGLGLIDVVRISHAHSNVLDELMQTGAVTFFRVSSFI